MATASDKGRYVRVFNTDTGAFLHQFGMGSDYVDISCLAFDPEVKFLCINTSEGSVKIYSLDSAYNKMKEFSKNELILFNLL